MALVFYCNSGGSERAEKMKSEKSRDFYEEADSLGD